MPYIVPERRNLFRAALDAMCVVDVGASTFYTVFLQLAEEYARDKGQCYDTYNTIQGVFVCASLELERRTGADITTLDFEMVGKHDNTPDIFRMVATVSGLLPYPDMVAGDLNFVMTSLSHKFITHALSAGLNIDTAVGVVLMAMADAASDFYHETVAPYEDTKISLNGPVSELG